ncbi:MAG: response regulator [Bacteroidetes bacterium]|nr:response regulator [Bacteroidota bacterium]
MKFLVEDEGYEGIQFPLTETDIVGWVKANTPSVILMDLALRRKGGMEYIEEIKADPTTKDIPIIIITGRDLTTKEILELQVRGIKYLRKGRVEVQEIKDEIRRSIFSQSPNKPSGEEDDEG